MEPKVVKVVTCPHTGLEVVAQYDPGNTDGVENWLCLHNGDDKMDAEDVAFFKTTGNIYQR